MASHFYRWLNSPKPPLTGYITKGDPKPDPEFYNVIMPKIIQVAGMLGREMLIQDEIDRVEWEKQQKLQQQQRQQYLNQQNQRSVTESHPLQSQQIQVQRMSTSNQKPLTPPKSQLNEANTQHTEAAKQRAQQIQQAQKLPEVQVNPAPAPRRQNPGGGAIQVGSSSQAGSLSQAVWIDPRIVPLPFKWTDPPKPMPQTEEQEKEHQLQQEKRSFLEVIIDKEEKLQDESNAEWKQILDAFHAMPLERYEDIRKKENMRNLLNAYINKDPINWTVDPDTQQLFQDWRQQYIARPATQNPYKPGYRQLDFNGQQLDEDTILRDVTQILGHKPFLTEDHYVIIGKQAYGLYEARGVAKAAVAYQKMYGRELPPYPYPTVLPEQVDAKQWKSVYPDVTDVMNRHLDDIVQDVRKNVHDPNLLVFVGETASFFENNFANNRLYDMQVNYGLPGQQLPANGHVEAIGVYNGHPIVKTVDQRALFRGKVVHAGYLSNYAYGYAIGATNWHKGTTDAGAYYAAIPKAKMPDKDALYFHAGYDAFWADHPELKRGGMQY
jgi:hypothetical protein